MAGLTASARRRLENDRVAWLTTIRPDGSPATRPVWFVWREPELLVFSAPHTHKVRHLAADRRANVHFNSDDQGGSIVVLDVEAVINENASASSQCVGYLTKYAEAIARLGLTVEAYDRRFSTLLRLIVRRSVDTEDALSSD